MMETFEVVMKAWPEQGAEARLNETAETCLKEESPNLKALLLTEEARGDLNIPPRGTWRRRSPVAAE